MKENMILDVIQNPRKEAEKEAESKYEAKEEGQREAEETECEAQEAIKEEGHKEEFSWFKTREEVRRCTSSRSWLCVMLDKNFIYSD